MVAHYGTVPTVSLRLVALMAITVTSLGSAQSKAANTGLSEADVSLAAGDFLLAPLVYETDAAFDTIKWGSRSLKLIAGSIATQGDTRVAWYRSRVRDTAIRDVDADWAANMSARVLGVVKVTGASINDLVPKTATFVAGTTAPDTGSAGTTLTAETVQLAAFASGGPLGDTAGTIGNGHSLVLRDGTTGGGAATNVTLQVTSEILAATGDSRASLSGATGRIWACSLITLKAIQTFTITDVGQDHRDQNENPDWVVVRLEDEANLKLRVEINPVEFDDMSDAQVTEKVTALCTNYADRLESESVIDIDSTRDTRMATFINDTIII